MFTRFGNGINGFSNPKINGQNNERQNRQLPIGSSTVMLAPPEPYQMSGEYGSIYNIGPRRITVVFPGNVVPIRFSNNALLSQGIIHIPESAEIAVCCPGNYEISFTLYFIASSAAFGTFAIEKNTVNLSGGVFSKMLSTDYQIYSGTTMASLDSGDVIGLSFTAPLAIDITLTGNDVSAVLNIKKLN